MDGGLVDTSVPQTLEYGLHQLIARAEGYHSITQYIRVAQESLAFDLTLEEADAGESQELQPQVAMPLFHPHAQDLVPDALEAQRVRRGTSWT